MKILTKIKKIADPRMLKEVQHNLSTIMFVTLCVCYADVKIGVIYRGTVA